MELTHYWTQRFPAGKEVVVEHSYRPALWQSYAPMPPLPALVKKFCIDGGTEKAMAAIARSDEQKLFYVSELNYILKTARNWSGPIGDFRLILDKGDPKSVISLCVDGVKKTGPTRFEVHKTSYVPEADLAVLFVTTRAKAPQQ